MADKSLKQIMATFLLVTIALALTPSVASFVTDAAYQYQTEYKLITAGTSNSTSALTYNARNDSLTNEYFTIVIVAGGTGTVSEYGSASINYVNFTYTESTKVVVFKVGVFDATKTYNMSITYWTDDLTSSVVTSLLPIVPILWIVAVLAVGITVTTVLLKRRRG